MKCPTCGIATDGAHSTKNRLSRYRAVDISTGEELFSMSLGFQTINIAEFLGVVEAVKYIIANDYSPRIVYTDSITAITWFKAKHTASKKRNPALQKAEVFLKAFAAEVETIDVLHWDNRGWGEIPADYGEK